MLLLFNQPADEPAPSAAAVWAYVMPDGRTAETVLMETNTMLREVWQEQGLDPANPLTVSTSQRAFASIVQTISESGGTITVTRQP